MPPSVELASASDITVPTEPPKLENAALVIPHARNNHPTIRIMFTRLPEQPTRRPGY